MAKYVLHVERFPPIQHFQFAIMPNASSVYFEISQLMIGMRAPFVMQNFPCGQL